MKRLITGVDIDEVLAECVAYAVKLFNAKHNQKISTFDVTGWAGKDVSWTRYFNDPSFVASQPVIEGAQEFIRELIRRGCEVIVITAVPMNVVPARVAWIRQHFPEIKEENIIIGKRKDVCAVDVLIDDNAHNVLTSPAKYPILMRKPWNQEVTGLTAVNGFEDCLNLIDTIMRQNGYAQTPDDTDVVCLIAPSGTGKTDVIRALMSEGYEVPHIFTTARSASEPYYRYVDRKVFEANMNIYAETTSYAGEYYGVRASDMTHHMAQHEYKLVIPLDICGANALHRLYGNRVKTVYLKRNRASLVTSILQKEIPDKEKALRILALDNEEKNEELCDYTIDFTSVEDVVAQILKI